MNSADRLAGHHAPRTCGAVSSPRVVFGHRLIWDGELGYVQKHPPTLAVLLDPPVRMNDRANSEAHFLEHLDWIDRVASIACSKNAIGVADADDFKASVRMKLMEDDYAVLRNFRGEGELKTYLASVVIRHFFDYSRERLGRWRPSAAAERMGGPAIELEALVHRDGYTLPQAGEKLRTAGRTTLSDVELARLLGRLPPRPASSPLEVAFTPATEMAPDAGHADDRVTASEADLRRREMMGVLAEALRQLEPEEQLIVRMHFVDGYTVAHVARALHLDHKPLYRRVERLRTRLRAYLESAGMRSDDVQSLLHEFEAR